MILMVYDRDESSMVPMCTIGMDGPHGYNRDGWSICVQ